MRRRNHAATSFRLLITVMLRGEARKHPVSFRLRITRIHWILRVAQNDDVRRSLQDDGKAAQPQLTNHKSKACLARLFRLSSVGP